jgi:hypothetical protein
MTFMAWCLGAPVMEPGDHGSTFGGGPVVAAPILVGSVIYGGTVNRVCWGLKADDGAVVWKQEIEARDAPAGFVRDWAMNRARFPRGVDVILCAGTRIAALPRTVRIEEA